MELKNYQKRVLKDLDSFLSQLGTTNNIITAYNRHWADQNVQVGFGAMPPYSSTLKGAPHVCFKVPTGGGKTYLACASVKHIFDGLGDFTNKVVAWLVPSNAILEQTIRVLTNVDHPYRQRLDADFGGRVVVLTKDQLLNGQNFNPSSVREQVTICVLSYDSLRSNKKDGRKMYQENGAMEPFLAHYQTPDTMIQDVDNTASMQVLNQLSPIVIVDESHNAESDLSVEMLRNLNPSFVLDLTATPKKNSNIISVVDARELKRANMVKLPVIVYNRSSKEDVLTDAIQLRASIEQQAKANEVQGGAYIRPIVLFQAQPKGKENAATFEKLKAELVRMGIPEVEIAIKTSEINEIKNVDLMSKDCPIRYIITVNALKEGWDCPFAYILATLVNKTSQVDVEQILGRILRLPYTKKHTQKLLNMAYVLTCSNDFRNTLENIVKGLNRAGFSRTDYRVGENIPAQQPASEQTSIQEPVSRPDEEDFLDIDFGAASETLAGRADGDAITGVAQMIDDAQQQGDDYDAETERVLAEDLPIGGMSAMKKQYKMEDHFAEDAKALLPIFIQKVKESLFTNGTTAKLSREALSVGFSLADKDTQISFESATAEIWEFDVQENGDATPKKSQFNPAQIREFRRYLDTLPSEERKRQCIGALYNSLNRNDALESGDLRRYIVRIVGGMDTSTLEAMEGAVPVYAKRIQIKIDSLLDEHREKTFNSWIETNEIVCEPIYSLPKYIDPLDATTSFIKSLYEGEAPMNDFEDKVINQVAALDNVLWWHRVQERKPNEFCLNGFINHYPDFIVRTKSGMTVLIETKGDHLDNADSRMKVELGKQWESLAGRAKYRYYMVFEDKDVQQKGAYRFSDFMGVMKQL